MKFPHGFVLLSVSREVLENVKCSSNTHYLVLMAVFRIYRFPDIWNFPVQAVGGYENVMLDISVLEYALFLLFTKFLFCICVAMISSFLSLASRNTYVSAALHCIVAGIWYLVSNGKNMGDMWSALLRGGGKTLASDFPFVCIGNSAVFHGLIYSVVLVLIALLLFGGIMACSETLMKRRVS